MSLRKAIDYALNGTDDPRKSVLQQSTIIFQFRVKTNPGEPSTLAGRETTVTFSTLPAA